LHHVFREEVALGTVVTRRVKGEHGAIEIVLALDPEDKVIGLHLQRLREPEAASKAVENPAWLDGFRGMTGNGLWQNLPEPPQEAQVSGQAIVDGVRSLLALVAVSKDGANLARHH
jgi:hypothetical protein